MLKEMLSRRNEEPFFLITVLLLIIIAVYNWVIALLALILIIGAYVLTRKNTNERNREISQFFDAVSQSVDQASTYAVQNLPIGIAIVDMQSSLCWANSVFRDWIGDIDNDQKLDHIMPNLNIDKFWGKFGYFFEHIDKRYYRVVYKYLQTEAAEDDNYLILYFEDITDTETQKMNCIASVPVLCDIEIDNMEEVAKGMTSVQQTTLWTNVNNCLIDELTSLGAFVRSYGNEKYFACLSREALDELKKDNFSFLEKIRMIHTVNRIPVTLSMGVAACPKDVVTQGMVNFNELADKAQAGLDLALGRGGDQVVVYEEDGSPHFYGGKTRSVEKNTRVRARVVAQAIRELIDTSDLVLVMGHEREDYDSIGAAVGVAHMARIIGKPVHIVISKQTDAIRRLETQILNVPAFKDLLISAETAEELCNSQTLLFIVDTHRTDMTVAPALIEQTERRVVIDHHRRSSDFIKKPLLTYTEPSSSSTSELVTELLQYYQEDVELEKIEATLLAENPQFVVIDSIQTLFSDQLDSAPGSVTQVRECSARLTRIAKSAGITLFFVGHVTKEGSLAGPRVLEHIVDTVLYFEGDTHSNFRLIRAFKNRFGAVNELGVFAMTDRGLKGVNNPSAIFLSEHQANVPGSVVLVTQEGTRPLLVEVQALVDTSHLPSPKRLSVGLDPQRLSMLLAVLHRHAGLACFDQDVFVNAVGGVKITEPAADLAVLAAIYSSMRNRALPEGLIVFGEVGLAGEIRPAPRGQERLKEAAKLGFNKAVIPRANAPKQPIEGLEVIAVDRLRNALDAIL